MSGSTPGEEQCGTRVEAVLHQYPGHLYPHFTQSLRLRGRDVPHEQGPLQPREQLCAKSLLKL